MAEDIGLIFGFGFSQRFRNFRADTMDSSADGGRYTRIDRLIDDDGPLRGKSDLSMEIDTSTSEQRRNARKQFTVTMECRRGGTGLYQGRREPKKEEEKE